MHVVTANSCYTGSVAVAIINVWEQNERLERASGSDRKRKTSAAGDRGILREVRRDRFVFTVDILALAPYLHLSASTISRRIRESGEFDSYWAAHKPCLSPPPIAPSACSGAGLVKTGPGRVAQGLVDRQVSVCATLQSQEEGVAARQRTVCRAVHDRERQARQEDHGAGGVLPRTGSGHSSEWTASSRRGSTVIFWTRTCLSPARRCCSCSVATSGSTSKTTIRITRPS
jgi:hypothetical protein